MALLLPFTPPNALDTIIYSYMIAGSFAGLHAIDHRFGTIATML